MCNREAPKEVFHLWLLTKVLTTFKGDPAQLPNVMRYVISVSHPKIIRRFETESSQDYWKSFESGKSDDILFSATPKRAHRQVEVRNDLHFLGALKRGVIDYAEKFPSIAKIVEELPNLERSGTTFDLFNSETCNEYHDLFIALVKQYKTLLEEIATSVGEKKPFGDKLGPAVKTGHAILTMVEGRAFHLYLPTIVSKLSKTLSKCNRIRAELRATSRGRGVKERSAEEQNTEIHGADKQGVEERDVEEQDVEEQDVKVGMTLWEEADAITPMAPWKVFKSWIMLMLVQFDATDALCTFVNLVPNLSSADVEVKIVYSPIISNKTIPLDVLLTKYIPEAAPNNSESPTNAKLADFIKAAFTVKRQARCISSFRASWGPQHIPAATEFLQEILKEVAVENGSEDSEDGDGEVDRHQRQIIAELSRDITNLLPQPAQIVGDMICRKFWALGEALNLKERQERYGVKFADKQTFRGALHCEAGLASILDETTRRNIQDRINASKQPNGTWKGLTNSEEQLYSTLSQLLEETKVGFVSVQLVPINTYSICDDRGSRASLGYQNVAAQCAAAFSLFSHSMEKLALSRQVFTIPSRGAPYQNGPQKCGWMP